MIYHRITIIDTNRPALHQYLPIFQVKMRLERQLPYSSVTFIAGQIFMLEPAAFLMRLRLLKGAAALTPAQGAFSYWQRKLRGNPAAELGNHMYYQSSMEEVPLWANWKKYAAYGSYRRKLISSLAPFVKNFKRSKPLESQLGKAYEHVEKHVFEYGDQNEDFVQDLFENCKHPTIFSVSMTLVGTVSFSSNFADYKLDQMLDAVAGDIVKGYYKGVIASYNADGENDDLVMVPSQEKIINNYLKPCFASIKQTPHIALLFPVERMSDVVQPPPVPEDESNETASHYYEDGNGQSSGNSSEDDDDYGNARGCKNENGSEDDYDYGNASDYENENSSEFKLDPRMLQEYCGKLCISEQDAEDEEKITKAYRALALKFHPDKNPGKTKVAEGLFKQLKGKLK